MRGKEPKTYKLSCCVKGEGYMKEEMIRSQAMAAAGRLSQEEQRIGELGTVQSPDITIETVFFTIFCC